MQGNYRCKHVPFPAIHLRAALHVNLSLKVSRSHVVYEDKDLYIRLSYLFFDRRSDKWFAPYTGHIMARFDVSTLPQHADTDGTVLVLAHTGYLNAKYLRTINTFGSPLLELYTETR